MRERLVAVIVAAAGVACSFGREPAPSPLGNACVSHPRQFSGLASLRETSDGAVIVADAIERSVERLDFDSMSTRVLTHAGTGPNEVAAPTIVLAVPSDSTLVFDGGNRRYLMLDEKAMPARTFSIEAAGYSVTQGQRILFPPRATDMFGNIYFELPSFVGAGPTVTAGDSATVVRYNRRTGELRPVAKVLQASGFVRSAKVGTSFSTRIGFVGPLDRADGWTVLPDGSVAIVRSEDYHVEYVHLDGRRTVGTAVPYDHVKVTTADREEIAALRARAPSRGAGSAPNDAERQLRAEEGGIPDEKPAFSFVGVYPRANGELWVLRHTVDGFAAVVLDVFDPRAVRTRRVELPRGTFVLQLSENYAYLGRMNADDLQVVQRCNFAPR